MAYIIGYLAVPVVIAVLITNLAIAKNYQKKHEKAMGVGVRIAYIIGITVGLLLLAGIGKIA